VLGGGAKTKNHSYFDADADWSRPVHTSTVRSKQNRCAFHNHDSYGIRETCAELGSVISISHELCLVMSKVENHVPVSMELSARRYSRGRSSGAKEIPDGHETSVGDGFGCEFITI
jgi:hypothetical protein